MMKNNGICSYTNRTKILIWILICVLVAPIARAKIVKYHFDIDTIWVNFTGQKVKALAINNKIPAPTIEAKVGDTVQITFDNKTNEESSIHWHGVLLPNDQDGVPYLTTQPISPKSSFTYSFKVKHSGTYWYHSHTGLQEQRGVYGSIIFHPKKGEKIKSDRDYIVVLSDWTNENPNSVLANLKKDGDYYALKKDSVQSWDRVLQYGAPAIKNRLQGAWTRMGPMDLSDIGYDSFLANGKPKEKLYAKANELVRIRLINAAASSYFNIEFANSPMTIINTDGMDVNPQKTKRFKIAIAETYDLILKIPENKSYELRATAEDGTGYSSTFIGHGKEVFSPDISKPNLFLIDHSSHSNHLEPLSDAVSHNKSNMSNTSHNQPSMSHNNNTSHKSNMSHNQDNMHQSTDLKKMIHNTMSSHKMNPSVIDYMTDYKSLRSVQNTTLPHKNPIRKITLNLTGNMERYTWSFNEKTLLESDKILINKGENVRLTLINQTMMHHPIHLHGHFFRVLNGQGIHSPLKHTINVPAMDQVEIEFEANEEKDWFFHCHNLYHMKTGMARVISYKDTTTATSNTFAKLTPDTWYFAKNIAGLSNMMMGSLRASNTRNTFMAEYDYNYKKEYDVDITYERNITRFLDVYLGANLEHEDLEEKPENTAIFGFKYVLPMLIESDWRINSKGKLRLGLNSDLQLTNRIKFEWLFNTDLEYRLSLLYEINKNILLITTYDSDFKWGAGLKLRI